MTGEDGGPSFVDTNVLVYAFAADDGERAPIAQALIRRLMTTHHLRTSTQILQELYVTLTRKVRERMSEGQALRSDSSVAGRLIRLSRDSRRHSTLI